MKDSYLRQLDEDIVGDSTAIFCHWCGKSQTYAGGDALITLLHQGYHIEGQVLRQVVHFQGNRHSEVFHFRLEQDNVKPINISVLHNPFVMRLILRLKLKVYKLEEVQKTTPIVEKENNRIIATAIR